MTHLASQLVSFATALKTGDIHTADSLLEQYPNLLDNGSTENNSLIVASLALQREMVPWLRTQGATVDLTDESVLETLCDLLISSGTDISVDGPDSTEHWVELHAQYDDQYLDVIEKLLLLGAKGDRGLQWTGNHQSPNAAEMLLKYGANPNFNDGTTALHLCADPMATAVWEWEFSGDKVAKLLIEAGAEVNARDRLGQTPLHAAALGQYDLFNEMAALALVLVENEAELDAVDPQFNTPLHYAALGNNYPVAKILLEHGADSSKKNYQNQTALEVAKSAGHNDVARLIDKFEFKDV